MFRRILAHPNIELRLKTDFRGSPPAPSATATSSTPAPSRKSFDHRFALLLYRSLRFEPETLAQEYFQPVMQVNYPNDHDFTRIVEIKHATGQKLPVTTIVREYPEDFGPGREPYYPIPAPDARALYQRYADRAAAEPGVSFVGRLATYRYYNMDQVVGMALVEPILGGPPREGGGSQISIERRLPSGSAACAKKLAVDGAGICALREVCGAAETIMGAVETPPGGGQGKKDGR